MCHGDLGTPHGCALHWIEQDLANHSEQVMHMGPRHQNSRDIRHLQEKIEEQTRSIVGLYQEAIESYLTARVRYIKASVLNEIKQPKMQKQIHERKASSEEQLRSPKLPINSMESPQQRKAYYDESKSASPKIEDDREQSEERIINSGVANTTLKRDGAPVKRVREAETVAKTSSEQMEENKSEKRRLKLKADRIKRRNEPMSENIKAEMNWVLNLFSAKIAEKRNESATATAKAMAAATAAPAAAATAAPAATATARTLASAAAAAAATAAAAAEAASAAAAAAATAAAAAEAAMAIASAAAAAAATAAAAAEAASAQPTKSAAAAAAATAAAAAEATAAEAAATAAPEPQQAPPQAIEIPKNKDEFVHLLRGLGLPSRPPAVYCPGTTYIRDTKASRRLLGLPERTPPLQQERAASNPSYFHLNQMRTRGKITGVMIISHQSDTGTQKCENLGKLSLPYINPSKRPPPDRDKTTRRVRHDKGCRNDRDKTRRVRYDKGCRNQNGSRKGVLDIGYLGIRACARMRTQYSFGGKRARARMSTAQGFGAKHKCARIAEAHVWPARRTRRPIRICRRRNFLPASLIAEAQ